MVRLGWLGLLTLVILTAARDASAFCRTTTESSAPDYDATTEGCWAHGLPLFWKNACVGYSMQASGSRKISYEKASNGISTAFTRWTGATCPTDGTGRSRTSIDVRDLGPAECAVVEFKSNVANQNVIIFRDDNWKYGKEVLGLTTVNYNPETGEIYNADMELNTFDMEPLAAPDEKVEQNAYDFLSVATHETGHFLGMAHSEVPGATMYARYQTGQTNMRYLSPDDVNGICTVYRPDGRRSVRKPDEDGVGYVLQAPQCDPTPRGGYSSKCQEKPRCSASGRPASTSFGVVGGALGLALALATRRLSGRGERRRARERRAQPSRA